MSKSLFFFIVLIFASFIFGQLFCQQIEGCETASFVERLAVSSHFLIDFLFITAVIIFLVNGSLISRIAGYMIFALLILIYSLQYVSIYLTGDYLSALAIDNIQHIGLILTTSNIAVAGSLCVFLLVMIATAEHYFQKTSWINAGLLFVCCYICLIKWIGVLTYKGLAPCSKHLDVALIKPCYLRCLFIEPGEFF